ncbi:periplasmic binding protein [Methanospirillum hungatei JF-1]|jgi:iron complex transport system substrate-binding protein|uniref:Periplasmic binding protein n=1 Tax=Methanospirillum hungatei JF-1 (strain ATCC 27890 / DSM 864 / NBRC 100397 / JF-1) TaxID=323259 RepID=Q2FMP6_METHJ|nr:ABC transporter substrate-binding protein [Methanospirillum hungatei]ABD39959.1 periplasmic binding protein [Methanospirillum hungatei JF-1]
MKKWCIYGGVLLTLLTLCCLTTTGSASGMEFTLYIFGNANSDMNIDQQDIDLINEIAAGKTASTPLADANQDGKVDSADAEQVQKIIDGTATEMWVQDAFKQPVKVKTPVQRLITLDRMIAENAQVIGVGDKIVGIDENTVNRDIILPTISKQKNLGSAEEPDMEALIALKPDLIVNNQYFDEGLMKKLQESGLTPLAMIYHGDIQNSLGYSKMLGYLTGSPSTAEEYVNWMGGTLGSIHDKVAGLSEDEKTKVIYLYPRKNGALGSGGNDCPTIKTLQFLGADTMTQNTKDTAGKIMDTASYFEIDPEVVIAKNPEAIVMEDFDEALGYGYTDKNAAQAELDRIKSRPGFDKLDAVKNNKVYLLDVNIVSHSNCLGALYMAKALYPDQLSDIDPYAIHQEYVDRFLKVPGLDVKKDGIFIYPQIS